MTAPRLSDPPARQILGVEQIDDLGAAIIALTRELWVVVDRVTMLETLLARHGIPIAELDTLQPDEATAALLATKRERLIGTMVAALQGER